MIHIVYPIQAQKDYTELLYSLRSVEKHITLPYEIILIGSELPGWVTNVTWINLGDIPGKKQLSIRRKILAALEYTEEILFMNDDVYLLQPNDPEPYYYPEDFEYFYYGTLKSYAESGSKSLMKQLELFGKPIKNFDGHYPLIYDRSFIGVSTHFSEDVIIKSMYCNYLNIEGYHKPDNKIIKKKDSLSIQEFIKDKPAFSTGIYSLKLALPILAGLFPNKSKFEI